MKSLYVASVEHFSGKTAVCLALGKRLQAEGLKVGYIKPLSLQPWMAKDHIADEDAAFVIETLGLNAKPWELSPVVVTSEFLRERLTTGSDIDLLSQVEEACKKAGQGKDLLLLEGGGSLREGYTVGLPTPKVATTLASDVLVIVRYRQDVNVIDDALAARARLGDSLVGILINRVPAQASGFIEHSVIPYLEKHNLPVFGMLPEVRALAALTVGELVEVLNAEVLTRYYRPQSMVQHLTVGAMTADAALSRFRQYSQKAVITGGDRTDIQLAALETSTVCLVLTGNIPPSPLVLKQAEEFGVAVIMVNSNTMEAVEQIDHVYGKTRLGQPTKFNQFRSLLEEHFDFNRLHNILGLKV